MDQTRNRLALFMVLLSLLAISCGGGGGEAGDSGIIASLVEDAAYPEAFSYLSGVRELPDGRLLAADPLSQVLLRVDMDSGTADTLGYGRWRAGGVPAARPCFRPSRGFHPSGGPREELPDRGGTRWCLSTEGCPWSPTAKAAASRS